MIFIIGAEWFRVAYYFFIVIFSQLCYVAINIPHQALMAELSTNAKEGNTLATYRQIFAVIGMLLLAIYSVVVFNVLVDYTPEILIPYSYNMLAVLPALFTFVFGILTTFFARPKHVKQEIDSEDVNVCIGLTQIFRIIEFDMMILIHPLLGLVHSAVLSFMPLYVIHVIGFDLATFTACQIVNMVSMLISLFVVSAVSKKVEKNIILSFGCSMGMFTFLGFYCIPDVGTDYDWLRYSVFFVYILFGISSSITYSYPVSMMNDVTTLTAVKFKTQHEGLMFSVMEMTQSLVQVYNISFTNFRQLLCMVQTAY